MHPNAPVEQTVSHSAVLERLTHTEVGGQRKRCQELGEPQALISPAPLLRPSFTSTTPIVELVRRGLCQRR